MISRMALFTSFWTCVKLPLGYIIKSIVSTWKQFCIKSSYGKNWPWKMTTAKGKFSNISTFFFRCHLSLIPGWAHIWSGKIRCHEWCILQHVQISWALLTCVASIGLALFPVWFTTFLRLKHYNLWCVVFYGCFTSSVTAVVCWEATSRTANIFSSQLVKQS